LGAKSFHPLTQDHKQALLVGTPIGGGAWDIEASQFGPLLIPKGLAVVAIQGNDALMSLQEKPARHCQRRGFAILAIRLIARPRPADPNNIEVVYSVRTC
jgi:hypothetical protein